MGLKSNPTEHYQDQNITMLTKLFKHNKQITYTAWLFSILALCIATSSRSYAFDYSLKCAVLGDENVGKTMLLSVQADEEFKEEYKKTVSLDYRGNTVRTSGQDIFLGFFDIAGNKQSQHTTLKTIAPSLKKVECFVFCYDVSKKDTFDNLEKVWLPFAQKAWENNEGEMPPIFLCGTKKDLIKDSFDPKDTTSQDRSDKANKMLQTLNGERYEKYREIVFYQETSAKITEGVKGFFDELASNMVKLANPQKETDCDFGDFELDEESLSNESNKSEQKEDLSNKNSKKNSSSLFPKEKNLDKANADGIETGLLVIVVGCIGIAAWHTLKKTPHKNTKRQNSLHKL